MGLDIMCGCDEVNFRAGSYSGFSWWRTNLAKMFGIDLNKMVGFGGEKTWTKNEPFFELLDHSDCDGDLTPNQCKELQKDFYKGYKSTELQKLFSDMKEREYWKAKYRQWKEAINHAIDNDCTLIFC